MAKNDHDHGHDDRSTDRLLVDILNTLLDTERLNKTRHQELLEAVTGRISDADRKLLEALLKRSETIAKKLEALDAKTP